MSRYDYTSHYASVGLLGALFAPLAPLAAQGIIMLFMLALFILKWFFRLALRALTFAARVSFKIAWWVVKLPFMPLMMGAQAAWRLIFPPPKTVERDPLEELHEAIQRRDAARGGVTLGMKWTR